MADENARGGLGDHENLSLWPSIPPGTPPDFPPPRVVDLSADPFFPDRELSSIGRPSLTAVTPARANGTAVIVAPGGGYSRITMDHEGREIAAWLGGIGVTTFLMSYRLPAEGHLNGADVPLLDAQRAVRLVRRNAPSWGLDARRIGFMGASAAGHMAASLTASFDRPTYLAVDETDAVSARPDFTILLYPVVTMDAAFAHPGSRLRLLGEPPAADLIERCSPELNIKANSPETFMVLADDDHAVKSENAIRFYQGLKRAGVPAEMHIFRDGGHGFGIERVAGLPASAWPDLCEKWLGRIGMLPV